MDYIYRYRSPLGGITLASDGRALTGLWFDDQKYFGDTLTEEYEERDLPVFAKATDWLDIYFSGKDPGFMVIILYTQSRSALISSSRPTCRVSKNMSLLVITIITAAIVITIVSTHFVSGVIAIFSCMKFINR